MSLGAAYSHSELEDIPTAYSGVRDQQALMAPRWTVNGSLSKGFRAGPGNLKLQWSFDYIGERYTSIENNPATFLRSSVMHNARVIYDLEEQGLEFAAYVDNVADEDRAVFRYDFIPTSGNTIVSYAKPRWYGMSVRKRF